MYQGFAYVSQTGILYKEDYMQYHASKGNCGGENSSTTKPVHLKEIGYKE